MAPGMMEESAYPTTGTASKCKVNTPTYKLNNFSRGPIKGDEKLLQQLLMKYGPLAVCLGEKRRKSKLSLAVPNV